MANEQNKSRSFPLQHSCHMQSVLSSKSSSELANARRTKGSSLRIPAKSTVWRKSSPRGENGAPRWPYREDCFKTIGNQTFEGHLASKRPRAARKELGFGRTRAKPTMCKKSSKYVLENVLCSAGAPVDHLNSTIFVWCKHDCSRAAEVQWRVEVAAAPGQVVPQW